MDENARKDGNTYAKWTIDERKYLTVLLYHSYGRKKNYG